MRTALIVAVAAALFATAPAPALAGASGVGLGVSVGAVFPSGDIDRGGGVETLSAGDTGLAWGFWVDIPIAWKFHITPSAELYNIGGDVDEHPATDICLNFKFIIPTPVLKIFVGAAGGVSVTNDYNANAGIIGGLSFPLIPSLEAFVSAKYKILIDDVNLHMIHTNAGLLFVF